MSILTREPAVVIGFVVSVIVLVASALNIVVDDASVTEVVTPLVTGLIARFFVSPANTRPGAEDVRPD